MRVLVITIGTRGDVQPFIALSLGLKRRGHRVTLCTSTRYAEQLATYGLEFAPLSDDLVALIETPEGRRTLAGTGGPIKRARGFSRLLQRSLQIQRELFAAGWSAALDSEPELIVFHPKMAIALDYAERLAIPAVMAPLFPLFNPTSAYPAPGVPILRSERRWTAVYNKASHRMLERTIGLASRCLFAPWRTAVGLPRRPWFEDLLHRDGARPAPLLNAWSQHLLPDPADSDPDRARTTGFWCLDHVPQWQPDEKLERFLDQGDPPVFVGFGSMRGTDPARTTRIVLDALDRAGVRGVLARGWGGLQDAALPENVLLLDEAPHDWLFERVAAVVHHGGAGTTAAGLRAGRPSVICPFFGDQPFWAWRVQRLGVGPAPIPQRRLNAASLADAIRQSVECGEISNNARALGQDLKREDGVAAAVDFIEDQFDTR
jgi:sterol 3beta-glucosyltransferase